MLMLTSVHIIDSQWWFHQTSPNVFILIFIWYDCKSFTHHANLVVVVEMEEAWWKRNWRAPLPPVTWPCAPAPRVPHTYQSTLHTDGRKELHNWVQTGLPDPLWSVCMAMQRTGNWKCVYGLLECTVDSLQGRYVEWLSIHSPAQLSLLQCPV